MIAIGKSPTEAIGNTLGTLQASDHSGDIDIALVCLHRKAAKARPFYPIIFKVIGHGNPIIHSIKSFMPARPLQNQAAVV